VDKADEAGSLRLKWSGQLNDKPEINVEKKVVSKSADSKELRISIKEKYIQPFLKGEYKMGVTQRK
jgi:SPX domain protein involved in polyphosphate accumulation